MTSDAGANPEIANFSASEHLEHFLGEWITSTESPTRFKLIRALHACGERVAAHRLQHIDQQGIMVISFPQLLNVCCTLHTSYCRTSRGISCGPCPSVDSQPQVCQHRPALTVWCPPGLRSYLPRAVSTPETLLKGNNRTTGGGHSGVDFQC